MQRYKFFMFLIPQDSKYPTLFLILFNKIKNDMLVINIEILKENINDYYLSEFYVANNTEDMLSKQESWKTKWENRQPKFTEKNYADFDIFQYIFEDDKDKIHFLTWNDSHFGKIGRFIEILNDLFISKKISKKKLCEMLNNYKNEKQKTYMFIFEPIDNNTNRKQLIQ